LARQGRGEETSASNAKMLASEKSAPETSCSSIWDGTISAASVTTKEPEKIAHRRAHSHVMLVSSLRGVARRCGLFDALMAFRGTVSGAPKVRAMEIGN